MKRLAAHEIHNLVVQLLDEFETDAAVVLTDAVQRAADEHAARARRNIDLLRGADQLSDLAITLRNASRELGVPVTRDRKTR